MARIGAFDRHLEPLAWWEVELLPAGWYVDELLVEPAAGGVTGTVASTLSDATLSATGTVVTPSTLSAILITGSNNPSYRSGFYSPRRGGTPKYPSLWDGCVGALAPSLGATGSRLFDQSLFGNHGTLTNMESSDWLVSDGKIALDFDGSNEYVNTPETWLNRIGAGDFAICAWIDTDTLATPQMVYAKDVLPGRSFALSINEGSGGSYSSGSMGIAICESDSQVFFKYADGVIVANRWIHILAMRNSGVISIYVNGVVVSSNGISFGANENAAIQATNNAARIGAREYSGVEDYFNGRIDDVRAYNRALTASEARLLASHRGIAFERASRKLAVSSASGSVTHTLDAATLSSSGTVSAGLTGSVSASLSAATLVSSGTVAAGASGSVSRSLDNATLSSSGTVAAGATGNVTRTLDNATLSSTGGAAGTVAGSVSATLAAATCSATGTLTAGLSGSVTRTLDAVTSSATGTVTNGASGTVTQTLANATLVSTGTFSPGLTAQVNRALDSCVVSSSGTLSAGATGTLSVQLASATLQSGNVAVGGLRIKVGSEWKNANAFVKVTGIWKNATPFVKVSGLWK
jgi:hypothetical protein